MPSCSKGARGLSVQSRVDGIFTATAISPSPWLRQRPSRYTIRAGRNLPDKEFRSVHPDCFQKGRTLSWLTSIHLRGNSSNLLDSFPREMIASFDDQEDAPKFLKIDPFPGLQLVPDEEWNNMFEQVFLSPHPPGHPIAMVRSNHSATEVRLECVEHLNVPLVLHDGELREYLIARFHLRMPVDTDIKAAFAVHKTGYPLRVKFHQSTPNVKSLRVPRASGPSLRIVPMSAGFLLPRIATSTVRL